jgi:hypothetical protein
MKKFLMHVALLGLLLSAAGYAAAEEMPDPKLRELLRAVASEADSFDDHYAAQVWLTDIPHDLHGGRGSGRATEDSEPCPLRSDTPGHTPGTGSCRHRCRK